MNLRLGAMASLAVVASLALVPLGPSTATADDAPQRATVSPPTAAPADRDATAQAAAAAVVADRAPGLHLSRHDEVVAGEVLRSGRLRFVPFERTHRELPVVGGDFVVVVDGDGEVVHTSVAQTGEVRLPDVVPTVAASVARGKSAGKVTSPRLSRSQLVVLQRGDRSDLAWQTTATGRRAGAPTRLDVYVDADSGAVLDTREHVQHGRGNPGWSGPAPVHLGTTPVRSFFSMTTPGAETLVCQDSATDRTLTSPDDVWGNGDPTNVETGCVDALYGAQQMRSMMSRWLGRNGMDGMGGWLPIRVGLPDQNAYYDGTQVEVGQNPRGEWLSAIDIVAHEFGHGVDDLTPGGIPESGTTAEFIADAFGAATEWFDNQPAPHDTRDFLVGEEVDFDGDGEIRNMYDPSAEGDPGCWSAAVEDRGQTGVHAAAGPGNHWFYLAAIGSNAAAQPVSPTCNGKRVGGIGVPKLMRVLYTAMLMKTSTASYQTYRAWTLVAARQLYGDATCLEFNRVKAAWDAVSVPALPNEATCTPGQGSVQVTTPSSRTVSTGTTILPFSVTASGGTAPYTWTAANLPSGMTISGSGEIDGSPALDSGGVYTVTVTATDATGSTGRGTFTITVRPSAGSSCTGERIANPGFERQTRAPWKMEPWMYVGDRFTARAGHNHALLGGWGWTKSDAMSQQVRVPEDCRASLTFHVASKTSDPAASAVDTLTVRANDYVLATRSNLDACPSPCNDVYVPVTVLLPKSFAGRTVTLSWTTQESEMYRTSWYVDDVSMTLAAVP